MDCFKARLICGEDFPDMAFLGYHGSMWRNVDMGGNTEIGIVISGCFGYVLLIHLSLGMVLI